MINPKKTWCCPPKEKKVLCETQYSSARRKLWELCPHFFCSVIGTCIVSNDLRELARKSGLNGVNKLSDYDIHRLATSSCSDEQSRFTKLIQNYLEKQARACIKLLTPMSAAELTKHWKVSLGQNDVKASYWALITHPIASELMVEKAFADIHMRSHLAENNIEGFQQQIDSLKRKLQLSEKKSQKRLDTIKKLQNQAELNHNNRKRSLVPSHPEKRASDALRLRVEAENLTAKLAMERLKNEKLLDELRLLQATHNQAQDRIEESQRELYALKTNSFKQNDYRPKTEENAEFLCTETIADPDLAGRCIVYVGGRTRQCGRFKNIVLKRNGRFLHHDGGLEDTNRLDSVLAKADAVMCPLDCVSHNAMVKARKHCKLKGKPLIMLEKSSLTAFSSGLQQVSTYNENS